MRPDSPGPYRRGQRVPRDLPRQAVEAVGRLAIHVVPPLSYDETTNTIWVDPPPPPPRPLLLEIMGPPVSPGRYPWAELVEDAAGNLVPGDVHGPDGDVGPAWELNGNDVVPFGYKAPYWVDRGGNVRFKGSQCP